MLDREALDILRDKTTRAIARKSFGLPGHEKRKILTGIDQLEDKRRAGDLEASWLPAEDAEARTAYSAISISQGVVGTVGLARRCTCVSSPRSVHQARCPIPTGGAYHTGRSRMHGKEEGVRGLAPRASAGFLTRVGGIDREPVNPLGEIRSWVKTEYPAMP